MLAFVQMSSGAAPSFAESIRSAEGFTIRQNPFSGCSQERKSLRIIAARSAPWQSTRISRGSEECPCPAPAQHSSVPHWNIQCTCNTEQEVGQRELLESLFAVLDCP